MTTLESNGPLVNPQDVGNNFVVKYYTHLYESPAEAHKFYLDNSLFGRPGLDGKMVYVYTLKDINEQIMSCDYQNSTIEILTVDSQTCLNTGVATLVTGFLIGKDGGKRTFSQSFFLVPQNGSYYVLNDTLRYLSEPQATKKESPQVVESKEVVEKVIVPSEAKVTVTKPVSNGHAKVPKEKVVSGKTNLPIVQDVAPKKSFAAIVGAHHPPAQVATPTKPVEKPKVSPEPKAPVAQQGTTKKPVQGGIFVGNLPMDATPKDLYETFIEFGAIVKGGTQVRSYQEKMNCFGFVEFEDCESVNRVLEAHYEYAIYVGKRRASIEVKQGKRNENGSKPAAQNNGNYRNDNGYGNKPRANGSSGGQGNGKQNSKSVGDGKKDNMKKSNGNAQTKN